MIPNIPSALDLRTRMHEMVVNALFGPAGKHDDSKFSERSRRVNWQVGSGHLSEVRDKHLVGYLLQGHTKMIDGGVELGYRKV